ncbi:uncharacterized protein [Cicer arietinum]|uniref:Uncharacterized protein LOC101497512 isoform X2 n=1 Tax=Cicer arietinum TaxID=3827 RepID=A0A1S2Z653_CICAR|nr:uncharacterized protein LOC101497512 isoform X2 [Cicer arietinum]
MLITMTSPSPGHRRKFSGKTSMSSNRKLNQNTSTEKHSGIVDRRYVSTTPKMQTNDSVFRLSKLLMKVTIENRLGAIQMLMLPEDTVGDLIEATLVFYEKEKRRPILMNTDPRFEAKREVSGLGIEEFLPLLKPTRFFKHPETECANGLCISLDDFSPSPVINYFLVI